MVTFNPHSGFWVNSATFGQFEKYLSSRYDLYSVKCDLNFKFRCTIKLAKSELGNFEYEKELCESCKFYSRFLEKEIRKSGGKTLKISEFSSEFNLTPEQLNIFSSYEIIIKYKKISLNFSQVEHMESEAISETSNVTFQSAISILKNVQPDVVFVYQPQYAVTRGFAHAAISLGIKCYYVAGNSAWHEMNRAIQIWDWQKFGLAGHSNSNDVGDFWQGLSLLRKFSYKQRLRKHKRNVFKSRSVFVYSTPKKGLTPRKILGYSENSQVLLAVMSSYDEQLAAISAGLRNSTASKVFKDQLDWLTWLIEWATNHPETTLVIRPHPRDFPNRRDSVLGEHAATFTDLFSSIPKNVAISWPWMGISLHDQLEDSKAITTGWSSAAFEASWHGIPTVNYDANLISYPKICVWAGETIDEYEMHLKLVLNADLRKPMKNKSRIFDYWFIFNQFHTSIRFRGTFRARISNLPFSPVRKVFFKLAIIFESQFSRIESKLNHLSKRDSKTLQRLIDYSLDNLSTSILKED